VDKFPTGDTLVATVIGAMTVESEAHIPSREHRTFRRFFSNLGPGLIAGAADDDPSGISTYSVAGATFGYLPLWTALFSFPLMSLEGYLATLPCSHTLRWPKQSEPSRTAGVSP
jgi:hypothetical protein